MEIELCDTVTLVTVYIGALIGMGSISVAVYDIGIVQKWNLVERMNKTHFVIVLEQHNSWLYMYLHEVGLYITL